MQSKTGLFYKYNIEKSDGSEMDINAQYFVLRYDNHQLDKIHMRACQKALLCYANEIEKHLPQLAQDLKDKIKLAETQP